MGSPGGQKYSEFRCQVNAGGGNLGERRNGTVVGGIYRQEVWMGLALGAGGGRSGEGCAVLAGFGGLEVKGSRGGGEHFSLTGTMHGHISRATCVASHGEVAHQEGH